METSPRKRETVAPPQILGQPQNRVVAPGDPASFSVVLADTRAIFYQWRFNGADIGGASGDALLVLNAQAPNEGLYSVVVANSSGSVTSAPAMLMLDSDGDGMADSWELAWFGNLSQTANGDFDGDGSSNLQEFLNGTDPTDNTSVRFRLTITSEGGGSWVADPAGDLGYTNGQMVTLTAFPLPSNTFHAWIGDINSRSNPLTLVMTTNIALQAYFNPIYLMWTNLAAGDWSVASNWNPNLVPAWNDYAIVTAGATVTVNSPSETGGLTLGGVGTVLSGSNTLTLYGACLWTGGTMGGTGKTVINAGGTLEITGPGPVFMNTRTLENGGTVLWTSATNVNMTDGVITNRVGALFLAQNAAALNWFSGSPRFDNAGIFRKSVPGTTAAAGVSFNNYGGVDIQAGTLLLGGGGLNNGTMDFVPGTTLNLSGGTFTGGVASSIAGPADFIVSGGTATLAGLLNLAGNHTFSGGTTTITGNYICTNSTVAIYGGTATFSGTDTVMPAVINLSGGTLGGSGVVTAMNQMNWTGGGMNGTGRTLIVPGATLNISNPSSVTLTTRTLENGGTVLWTSATNINMTDGVITNRAGALFLAQNAAALNWFSGFPRFDNAGIFRKTVPGTTTAARVSFNNYGAVDIQAGTLLLGGGGLNNSTMDFAPGTTLNLSGGTFTGGAASSIAGPGDFIVSGGTATLAGLLNLTGNHTFSSGTATFTGNYICTNNSLAISGGAANFGGTGMVMPAVINLSSGTLGGSGVVMAMNQMNWTGGGMNGTGRTLIVPGATLNISNPSSVTLTTRTLENGGTVLWTSATNINMTDGVITNRAGSLFLAQNAAALNWFSGSPRFDNTGTFRKSVSTGTTTFAAVSFNNYGMADIQTGTLLCTQNVTNSGTINLWAGTTNRLAGGGSATGQFNTPATALVEWTGGTFTLNAGSQLNGSGQYRINGGAATFIANSDLAVQNLDLLNGTLNGAGTLRVNGSMNWSAGSMGGVGHTVIASGGTLNLASPGGVTLSRLLENGGTAVWTGAGNIVLSGGAITNRAGGLFDARNTANFTSFVGGNRIDNAGTFRKSLNTGTTTLAAGVPFTNYGTVDIQSGIVAANGGYASISNALLNLALGGTVPGTNYGQLQVAGTVTLNGALTVVLTNGYAPTTNDTFTILTAGTRTGSFGGFFYPSNQVTMQLSNTASSVIVRVTAVATPPPPPVLMTPLLAGTNVLLTWTAISNITYRLEFNPDLTPSNWNAVPGDVPASSNTAIKLDALTPSNRLYRVRVIGP